MKVKDRQSLVRYIDAIWAAVIVVWCAWRCLVMDAAATFLAVIALLRLAGGRNEVEWMICDGRGRQKDGTAIEERALGRRDATRALGPSAHVICATLTALSI